MRRIIVVALLGLAFAAPAGAQVPNVQQLLQGLTSGNHNQDQGLRDAFERGYQRGRQDQARQDRSDRGRSDHPRGRDEHGPQQGYERQGNSYNR